MRVGALVTVFFALVTAAAISQPLPLSGVYLTGDTVFRTMPGKVMIAVDTINEGLDRDGLADHIFYVQSTAADLSAFDSTRLQDANIEFAPHRLRITSQAERLTVDFDLSNGPVAGGRAIGFVPRSKRGLDGFYGAGLPKDWTRRQFSGFGLAHHAKIQAAVLMDNLESQDSASLPGAAFALTAERNGLGTEAMRAFCQSGGYGAQACSITCSGGQGCSVSCGTGFYACCRCIAGGPAPWCDCQPR